MNKYDEQAIAWQKRNRETEGKHDHTYSPAEIQRAIAYTREDVTMLVSYMSSLNEQIIEVRRLLIALIAVVVVVAILK